MVTELIWDSFCSESYKRGDNRRSGYMMECLCQGSLVKVSALCGPSGSALSTFLPFFVEEFQLVKGDPLQLDDDALSLLEEVKDQKVPFFVAIRHTMSDQFRSIPGVYTGTCPDVKDSARIDGLLQPDHVDHPNDPNERDFQCQMYMTFEYKNYKDAFESSDIDAGLERTVKNSRGYHEKWILQSITYTSSL